MRLSWKLFFITTPVFVLFLTVFGCWIVEDNFRSGLSQEAERCMMENQMFQNSYELTWNALSEEQQEQTTARMVVESFSRERSGKKGNYRIYGEDGGVLYQDNSRQVDHQLRDHLDGENNVGYEVVLLDGEAYLAVLSRGSFGLYFETVRDISDIFSRREALYARYRMGVLFLTVLVGGVMMLVIFLVMRNMRRLSRTVRQFARGNYESRALVKSRDEIGMLAEDFNWMAGAMNMQMERLRLEVRRQEEFTAAFAHELKTPLTSIIGYADTIRQMELSKEETDMCAGYIHQQGKRLQSLSYKLLELAMADKQEIAFKEISVPGLFEEVGETLAPALGEKKIELLLDLQEGSVYGDRELLASLFLNLIDNARKASDPGRHISVRGWRQDGGYVICVEDEGRGLPREELVRITEAFYMADKSRARKEGGAGLGLALCQKIVELHGAVWMFDSEPGRGLRVTVRFAGANRRQDQRARSEEDRRDRRARRKKRPGRKRQNQERMYEA